MRRARYAVNATLGLVACVARPIELDRELTVEEICEGYCDLMLCDNAASHSSDCVEICIDPRVFGAYPNLTDECIDLQRALFACYVEELGCDVWEALNHGEGPCAQERQAFEDAQLRGCGYARESVDTGG